LILRQEVDSNAQIANLLTTASMIQRKEYGVTSISSNSKHIHARVPRTKCEKCRAIRLIDVPWARRSVGFTLLMDSLILILAQNMPVNAVAEIIDEHDTRIWRVLSYYIPEARSKEDCSQVKVVGVDETSCAKFHKYISLFVDLNDNKVLYVCEGKDANAISSFRKDLEDHNGASENIEMFCSDMSPAFISSITEQFPGSSLTFDKFHVMKMLNESSGSSASRGATT